MVVRQKPSRASLGHDRNPRRLRQALKCLPGVRVGRGGPRDDQRSLGLSQQGDGLLNQRPVSGSRSRAWTRIVEGHLVLRDGLFLHVYRDREVHGAASAGVGDPERLGDHLRNAPYVRHHPRALRRRKRHADLVDLLHRSASQLRQRGGAADRQQRTLRVHGVAETGDGVGETRGGVHRDAGAVGNPAPRVGHVHRALLVAGVDEPEAHVVHDVEHRQDVVAGEGEYRVDARSTKRRSDELTSGQPTCRTHSDPPAGSRTGLGAGIRHILAGARGLSSRPVLQPRDSSDRCLCRCPVKMSV